MSELVLIGTSDAFGAGGRRQSAYLLRTPGGSVLLDCGGSTVSGLSALGIPRDEIDAILVTHFHADHFGGIPLQLLGAQCFIEIQNGLLLKRQLGLQIDDQLVIVHAGSSSALPISASISSGLVAVA